MKPASRRFLAKINTAKVFAIDAHNEMLSELTAKESKRLLESVSAQFEHEMRETKKGKPSELLYRAPGSVNVFMLTRGSDFFVQFGKESPDDRLSIYSRMFAFFPARIHIAEQTGSRLAITRKVICERTGFHENAAKSDLARLRKAWPLRRQIATACASMDNAVRSIIGNSHDELSHLLSGLFHHPTETDAQTANLSARMLLSKIGNEILLASSVYLDLADIGTAKDNARQYFTRLRRETGQILERSPFRK